MFSMGIWLQNCFFNRNVCSIFVLSYAVRYRMVAYGMVRNET